MIRKEIERRLKDLHQKAIHEGVITDPICPRFSVEPPRQKNFGDYASNIALVLAGKNKTSPRNLALWFVDSLQKDPLFSRVEVAGPGFINFRVSKKLLQEVVRRVLKEKENFGRKVGRVAR